MSDEELLGTAALLDDVSIELMDLVSAMIPGGKTTEEYHHDMGYMRGLAQELIKRIKSKSLEIRHAVESSRAQ